MADITTIFNLEDLTETIGEKSVADTINPLIEKEFPDGLVHYYKQSYDDEISPASILEYYNDFFRAENRESSFRDYVHDQFDHDNMDYIYEFFDREISFLVENKIMEELESKVPEGVEFDSDFKDDLVNHIYQNYDLYTDMFDVVLPSLKVNILFSTPEEQNLDQGSISDFISSLDGYHNCFGTSYPTLDKQKESEALNALNNGLIYLIHQQGHTPSELLSDTDSKFIKSVKQEMANSFSSMSCMTVLANVDFDTFCKLADAVNGVENDTFNSIKVSPKAEMGFFDPWHGSGSILEVDPETDVVIPKEYLFRLQIESGRGKNSCGYSVDEVYGLIGSAWKEDVISISEEKAPLLSREMLLGDLKILQELLRVPLPAMENKNAERYTSSNEALKEEIEREEI